MSGVIRSEPVAKQISPKGSDPMKSAIVTFLLSLVVGGSHAAYPDRPIRMIVPASAGTITDVTAREFSQALSAVMKQPVVIENLVGAEGIIGTQAAVRAEPDGHTILYVSSSTTVLDPVTRKSIPYDPAKDLIPACAIFRVGNVMNMSATLPFKTVGEFIAAAKAEPGKFTFGYSTATTRLAGELFQQQTGIKLTSVPYKGSAGGLTDVAGGQVHLFFIDHVSATPYYQSGKIKPLLVAGSQRYKSLPDVPSAAEAGFPGYEILPSIATFLPAKTPPPIVNQVRDALTQALNTPAFASAREKHGLEEFSVCGDALTKYQNAEIERWGQVMKKAGIEKQ
jgi:tripartite-type tricarboxylate transporter receptor subunit TctC